MPHTVNPFDIALAIFMDNSQVHLMSLVIPVIECDFSMQSNIDALVGRDVLSRGGFFYNGPGKTMTLNF
jgi:hypothetical protein